MDEPATHAAPVPTDLITYRLDKNEEAVTAMEVKVDAIQSAVVRMEAKLDLLPTRAEVAALPTRETLRNWNLAMIAAVVATFLTMSGLFLASAANQLSAFQAGLSLLQSASREPTR